MVCFSWGSRLKASFQKTQIFVKDVEKHVTRADRKHHVRLPCRMERKDICRARHHKHGNHFIVGTEYNLQIWHILGGLQDLLRGKARVLCSQGCSMTADRVEPLAKAGDRLAEAVLDGKEILK